MKKILVVFTGGTIGSSVDANGERDVAVGVGARLISAFRKEYGSCVEFETEQPYNILSENCSPRHWEALCRCIRSKDLSRYAGIIVTHGSDTLPYSAALLGFVYSSLSIPIVLTASNHPLDNPLSNGQHNFNNAVLFIMGAKSGGVYVVYRHDCGRTDVFLGTRLQESERYNDRFTSFGEINFGVMQNGSFLPLPHPANLPAPSALPPFDIPSDISFSKQVITIKSYPGLDYSCIVPNNNVAAVLCVLYHSATWCNPADSFDDDKYYLKNFFDRCRKQNIDLYLCSFKEGAQLYKSCGGLIKEGACALKNISFEAAYVKLNIAYNLNIPNKQAFINTNVFFEILP